MIIRSAITWGMLYVLGSTGMAQTTAATEGKSSGIWHRFNQTTQFYLLRGQSFRTLEQTIDLSVQHTLSLELTPWAQPGVSLFYCPYDGLETWGYLLGFQGKFIDRGSVIPGYFIRYGSSAASYLQQNPFGTDASAEGRKIWQAGFQFVFPVNSRTGLVLGLGFQKHEVTTTLSRPDFEESEDRSLNRMLLSLGFTF